MEPCSFCNHQAPAYTCPRCSLAYCSLKCYRSERHAECSESFYKDWVQEHSKGQYCDRSQQNKIMEMIRRNAENSQSDVAGEYDDFDEDENSDEEVDSLHQRLSGLDLDRDTDQIWDLLTPEEREEFERMLQTREILNIIPQWQPWWKVFKKPQVVVDDENVEAPGKLSVFGKLVSKTSTVPLHHDVCALVFAYCFLCRFLNGDFDKDMDKLTSHLIKVTPLFDGTEHRPASTAPSAVIEVVQRATSFSQEFAAILDDTLVCKVISDVALILKTPKKQAVCRVFVELLSIFERGIRLLKKSLGPGRPPILDEESLVGRKAANCALKKLEYFAGWIFLAEEDIFKKTGETLELLAKSLKSDNSQFNLLKGEIEQSGAIVKPLSTLPKIQEIS